MKISHKLALIVISGSVIASSAIGTISYRVASNELREAASNTILALRESRTAEFKRYLGSIQGDLDLLSINQQVRDGLNDFSEAFKDFGNSATRTKAFLGSAYTTLTPSGGPNLLAKTRINMLTDYHKVHQKYDPWFRLLQKVRGYHDIFLINIKGDIVYSVAKESDFATNMFVGKWKGSGLSQTLKGALSNPPVLSRQFVDFAPYGPSKGSPASFISAPIIDGGEPVGVLAFQMPIDRINQIMGATAGMGKTGETYIVGKDLKMRTDSRFQRESTILKTIVDTSSVHQGIDGRDGVQVIEDYRGVPVLSAYGPVNFSGVAWAILSEIDMEEVLAPIWEMRNFLLAIGILITGLIAGIGLLLARSITVPLSALNTAFSDFGRDRIAVDVPHTSRNDEIGQMAQSFETLTNDIGTYIAKHQQAEDLMQEKEAQLSVTLENLPGGICYIDDNLDVVVSNPGYARMFNLPPEMMAPGQPYPDAIRYRQTRDFPNDKNIEETIEKIINTLTDFPPEPMLTNGPDGQSYSVSRQKVSGGGLVTNVADVTQMQQAEARLRNILETSPSGVSIAVKGNIAFANARICEITGYERDDFLQRTTTEVFADPEDEKKPIKLTQAEGRAVDQEVLIKRPDGTHAWTLMSLYPIEFERDKGWLAWMYDITEQKSAEQRMEQLSAKLSKYLSPQVYDSIFSGEQDVTLSTSRKKLTVFFSDIKDFTATTEDLEPEELTFLLNDYLTKMTEIALEYGATIDKYVGDAMLLFFGDPTTRGVKEDALACVRMAIAMQRRMLDLQAKWKNFGHRRQFHMRIGINTGYCNVGNFGSDDRMDYTIIGGEVNLAARLEGISDPDGIMLAQETYALVRDEIEADEQDPIQVKGISRDVVPYKIKGILDDLDTNRVYIRSETDAMRLYVDLRKLDAGMRIKTAEELESRAAQLRELAEG